MTIHLERNTFRVFKTWNVYRRIRALYRLLFFVLYSLLRILQILVSNWIQGEDLRRSMRIRRSWARFLLPRIGISIRVSGTPPDFPCVLMSNHRSYLDPILLLCDTIACPVSKAEVAAWPVIGYGARVSGVIFLKRENNSSRKLALTGIASKLAEGYSVILFPEGTTHADAQCRPFNRGGFKLAARELAPILPVAIDFSSQEDYWIGKDAFLPHFFRRFSEKNIYVQVHYGQPLASDDPEYLAGATRDWINRELADIQKSFAG